MSAGHQQHHAPLLHSVTGGGMVGEIMSHKKKIKLRWNSEKGPPKFRIPHFLRRKVEQKKSKVISSNWP